MAMCTIGILIIGGDQLSLNLVKFLQEELDKLCYNVVKITIFIDTNRNRSFIVDEIGLMVKYYDIVIIAGGVKSGVIFKIIEEITNNEQVIKKIDDDKNVYPLYYFQRIFLLSEDFYEETFHNLLKPYLLQYRKEPIFTKTYQILLNGNAKTIHDIDSLGNGCVSIKMDKIENSVINVELSTKKLPDVIEFEKKIKGNYKLDRVVDFYIPWQEVYGTCDTHIQQSLRTIENCLHQYGPDNIFLCFNGGKDCTVLLHLIHVVLKKNYSNYKRKLLCMYVQSQYPFVEQDKFIQQCENYYNLQVITIQATIKHALQQVLEQFPNLKACFMGTRRTDPFSQHLSTFQATDPDWPQVIRVSPLLEWHYSEIWDYLLYFKVPYCILYDMGFTSLGNRKNTIRNPSLIYYDLVENKETYLPAYKLLKETKERHGRDGK